MKPKLKTTLVEFMLVVPALALFILFVVYPLIGGIYYSFTSWNGIDINIKFVGFKNYLSIFKDKYVLEPMANTFIFAFFFNDFVKCVRTCFCCWSGTADKRQKSDACPAFCTCRFKFSGGWVYF